MTDTESPAAILYREMAAVGLLQPSDAFTSALANIMTLGADQRKWVRPIIGRFEWWQGLLALGYERPRLTNFHILGFARAMAEFLIAPVELDAASHETVSRLSTLACLIVTYYDAFLDGGRVDDNPLSPAALQAAIDPQTRRALPLPSGTRALPTRIMSRLVAEYFRALDALPFAGTRAHIRGTAVSAIRRMYHCQNATQHIRFGDAAPASIRLLLRKSIYPIVVMALPAWLAAPAVPCDRYRWHLRWLYRVGALFAWVDDIIDLYQDGKYNQPNAISGLAALSDRTPDQYRDFARALAEQGCLILDQWRTQVSDLSGIPLTVSQALPISLHSWFGRALRARSRPAP